MNSRTVLCFGLAALLAGECLADDRFIDFFETTQDQSTALVTVRYSLSRPAVVTLNVETNGGDGVWLPFGAIPAVETSGDVNLLVSDQAVHTITWNPGATRALRPIRDGRLRAGIRLL